MIVREIAFGTDDYRAACGLRQRVLRAPLGLALAAADVAADAGQLHVGLYDDEGRLVACVSAVILSSVRVKLRQMAVEPGLQRAGHGTRLLAETERRLAVRGVAEIVLHARLTAVGFYERLGYAAEGETFTEVTIPHVVMRKAIGTA